jgi:hypothetical protein
MLTLLDWHIGRLTLFIKQFTFDHYLSHEVAASALKLNENANEAISLRSRFDRVGLAREPIRLKNSAPEGTLR